MGKAHNPRRGSMQYWPRKRSRSVLARVRSWAGEGKAKPLGFIGYKVGMAHIMITDSRAKSPTKGEELSVPTTLIECPPLLIAGVSFYKHSLFGSKKVSTILASSLNKYYSKRAQVPKKQNTSWDNVAEFDDLRILVQTQVHLVAADGKKPRLMELALGGSKEEKLAYAKDVLGKELQLSDVFAPGTLVDVHGVTKGKGFQGTVKRFGVPIRQHKSEKTKRGIGNLGAWTPKRVDFRVAQAGKMGYHMRTEYNKLIMMVGDDVSKITPKSGFKHYGLVKNSFIFVKGSVMGPTKREVILTPAIRPNKKAKMEVAEPTSISLTA